jgi:hypothetical protein
MLEQMWLFYSGVLLESFENMFWSRGELSFGWGRQGEKADEWR